MKIDISYLDEWLMWNEEFSQEDRELIIEAIEDYRKYLLRKDKVEPERSLKC